MSRGLMNSIAEAGDVLAVIAQGNTEHSGKVHINAYALIDGKWLAHWPAVDGILSCKLLRGGCLSYYLSPTIISAVSAQASVY